MVKAIAALITSSVLSGSPALCREASGSVQPPPEYRHDAVVIVSYLSRERLQVICQRGTGPERQGCTIDGINYMPNPCEGRFPRDPLACHELGHRNGWNGEHPRQ